MRTCTYRGYEIAVDLQRRSRGHWLVAIDIRRGAAAWARYRDLPASHRTSLETTALAQARAAVDAIVAAESACGCSTPRFAMPLSAPSTTRAAQPA